MCVGLEVDLGALPYIGIEYDASKIFHFYIIMLTKKQKAALEKITGLPWNHWKEDTVKAYFSFTDRGKEREVSDRTEYDTLLWFHKTHPIMIEQWKKDFKSGLLFLEDFLNEELPTNYLKHVFEVYISIDNYLPSKYQEKWAELNGN